MELRLLVWFGAEAGAVGHWLTLALTYCLHAAVWALAALVLVRVRALSSAARHLCWKCALFGPVLTALVATELSSEHSQLLAHRDVDWAALSRPARGEVRATLPSRPPSSVAAAAARAIGAHSHGVLAIGFGAVGLGLLRFVWGALVLRRRLRGRRPVTDSRLLALIEGLGARMGLRSVALTECSAATSPLVIGRSEVCIPRRVLAELSEAELCNVLAHELAHLERGDGVWFPLAGALQSLLWFQPLNHWLGSRFRDSAELACDDRAVEIVRNPLGLARALLKVATNAYSVRETSLTPAMARTKSSLLPRVKRLTSHCSVGEAGAPSSNGRWLGVSVGVFAAGIGFFRIHVAEVRAEPAGRSSHRSAPRPEPSPRATEYGGRLEALARREHEITLELGAARRAPDAASADSSTSARVIELEQEQRHLRSMQAWLEEEFATESSRAAR